MKRLVIVAAGLFFCISVLAQNVSEVGIVPDSYIPPSDQYPGQFVQKISVDDACLIEASFAAHEIVALAAGASAESEIARVKSGYSAGLYEQAELQVVAHNIEFLSEHTHLSPDEASKLVKAACYTRAQNPRY